MLVSFYSQKFLMFFISFISHQEVNNYFWEWFAVPASLSELILKPWTLISYMFLHIGFIHILFNMLWLYSFGRLFLSFLDKKKLLSVYLMGGLAGAVLYIISFNLFPVFESGRAMSVALGASASVMAVVVAISTYIPNHRVYVPILGSVKIKYFAIVFIVSDLLFIYNRSGNLGGHIAHLGGALFGFYYIYQLKKGKDISKGFNNLMYSFFALFKKRSKLKVSHKKAETDMDYNKRKADKQKEVNKILDKISKSGYDSLTKKEKDQLFRMSNKNK